MVQGKGNEPSNLEVETVVVSPENYTRIDRKPPLIKASKIIAVTDTGAQSCLWGLQEFLCCGFSRSDLILVKHIIYAANCEEINVEGAMLLCLSGKSETGISQTAAAMVYVSPSTNRFYLPKEALIQLGISLDFLQIDAATETSSIDATLFASCGCPASTTPPPHSNILLFTCSLENNELMEQWLLERFASLTFNQCTHQPLPGMTSLAISFHVEPEVIPSAIHTPVPVPLHWHNFVKELLDDDVHLGALGKVPIGEPSE